MSSDGKTSYPKSKIKVLLLEKIAQSAVDIFVREGFDVETVEKLPEEVLLEKVKDIHILGVRSKTQVNKKLLDSAKKLIATGCFCIGTDQTDLEAAAAKGVATFNAPFANTRSVAELVLGELICLARQLFDRSSECHNKIWNKNSSNCYEVRGKTLCIIGYGHVGSQLSILAEAFGMRVVFYDILPKLSLGLAQSCNSLLEAVSVADFVSLHTPATSETQNLIGAKEIAAMKKGAYLVNASRGTVVDINAAAEALRSGHLGGAAFDVYPYEPAGAGEEFKSPLQGLKNVILTPHVGGSTEEAQIAIGKEVASKLVQYLNTGNSVGAVNIPELALPSNSKTHRILNIHHNQPGFLKAMNEALSDYNISAQMLMTLGAVGYLIIDVDKGMSDEIKEKIMQLKLSIKTRILY
jgi:D-3-phosphoglycerate dehydrogenase